MKLLSLSSFKDNPAAEPSSHSWPWPPYCQQPRTLSFREGDSVFRTIKEVEEEEDSGLSLNDDVAIETAVTAARSERRLFFEPEETSSILEHPEVEASECHAPFIEESVAVSMDSRDPYVDFRRSMGEMVAAHSLNGKPDRLEELLCWYLRANDKANHGYIFAAFVDLLITVQASGGDYSSAPPPPCKNLTRRQSPSSPLSFYTSSTSNSCCSSSTSSTPCHVSVMETEESSASSGDSAPAIPSPSCLPLNVAESIGDDSSTTSLDI